MLKLTNDLPCILVQFLKTTQEANIVRVRAVFKKGDSFPE